MDKGRHSIASTVIRAISLALQIGIVVILALLFVEIKQFRNADSDPVMVAVQNIPGSNPLDVIVKKYVGSPVTVEFPPTATPTVVAVTI